MSRLRRARYRARACQVLVMSPRHEALLLVEHLDTRSDFHGRLTGFIDSMPRDEDAEEAVARIAFQQAGVRIERDNAVSEVAVLDMMELGGNRASTSDVPAITREHEMLVQMDDFQPSDAALADASLRAHWFALNNLPFDRMPTDDEIWYPRVLCGERLRGLFAFHGTKLVVKRVFAV